MNINELNAAMDAAYKNLFGDIMKKSDITKKESEPKKATVSMNKNQRDVIDAIYNLDMNSIFDQMFGKYMPNKCRG
jgi:hypothetical protein